MANTGGSPSNTASSATVGASPFAGANFIGALSTQANGAFQSSTLRRLERKRERPSFAEATACQAIEKASLASEAGRAFDADGGSCYYT